MDKDVKLSGFWKTKKKQEGICRIEYLPENCKIMDKNVVYLSTHVYLICRYTNLVFLWMLNDHKTQTH